MNKGSVRHGSNVDLIIEMWKKVGTILCGEADNKCKTGYGKRSVSGHLCERRKSQDKILKDSNKKGEYPEVIRMPRLSHSSGF